MAYIPLLQMRVKTDVQSVIARRRSCTDSKDPDAGSKRESVPASLTHPACTSLSPSPRLPSAILPLVFGLGCKAELTNKQV